MKLADALVEIARKLEEGGHRFALVGGIAASAHGEARFTRGVDVAVSAPDDHRAEEIFATSAIEAEIVNTAEPTEVFDGVFIPSATPEVLLAMKALSATPQRPRDLGDIHAKALANPSFDERLLRATTWLSSNNAAMRGGKIFRRSGGSCGSILGSAPSEQERRCHVKSQTDGDGEASLSVT